MILSSAQKTLSYSPYRKRKLDEQKQSHIIESEQTYIRPQKESWSEVTQEIRSNISNKISAFENDLQSKQKKELLYGKDKEQSIEKDKPFGLSYHFEKTRPSKYQNSSQAIKQSTFLKSSHLDLDSILNGNYKEKIKLQKTPFETKKSTPILQSYFSNQPKTQNQIQKEKFHNVVSQKFPGFIRENSLNLEKKIEHALIQNQSKQFANPPQRFTSYSSLNRPVFLKKDEQLLLTNREGNKSQQDFIPINDVKRVRNTIQDLPNSDVSKLTPGMIQELNGLQSNILKLLNKHKRISVQSQI